MPRDRTAAFSVVSSLPQLGEAPLVPSASLVASAVHYPNSSSLPRVYHGSTNWQRECYRHYRICGEARYAAQFFGHALSRATLSIGRPLPTGGFEDVTNGAAFDLLDELFSGKDGQSQMLASIGVHLTIAGECFLVGRSTFTDPDDPAVEFWDKKEHDIWEVVSVMEMNVTGNSRQIKHEGYQPIELTDSDAVIRIWLPDPADRTKPDSPYRSLLPVLKEIEYLTKRIATQTTSRLAGAGLMFVDQNLDFPPPLDADGKPVTYANQAHGVMLSMARSMEASLKDPDSVAARVPTIFTVPTEALKGDPAKRVTFWDELDAKARDLRNDSIKRFAIGMEMPPEQLLGMSHNSGTGGGRSTGVSHWGAWQIEEQTIKMFIEPFLENVVNALTVGYLRPILDVPIGTKMAEQIRFSTQALRLRPDRSKESVDLYNAGVLKASVMLKENGFEVTDAMDPEEFKRWLYTKLASGSATPDQVAAAAKVFGVEIPSDPGGVVRETPPPPSTEGRDKRPRTPAEYALLPAAEALVLRALERAGSRIRQSHGGVRLEGIPATHIHTQLAANGTSAKCMEGAWTTAEQVLGGIEGIDVARTVERLNVYTLNLLTTQQPHNREVLAQVLEAR